MDKHVKKIIKKWEKDLRRFEKEIPLCGEFPPNCLDSIIRRALAIYAPALFLLITVEDYIERLDRESISEYEKSALASSLFANLNRMFGPLFKIGQKCGEEPDYIR